MKHLLTITNCCDDWEWQDAHESLQLILDKTMIKQGFLEGMNTGWRKRHGITDLFEVNAKNVISKAGLSCSEWILKIKKEGHQLYLIRSSHDEPTGATILLKSSKHYNEVHNQIFN